MNKKFFIILGLLLSVSIVPASAYIDPGTGGYIISGIGPAIWAALLAALALFFFNKKKN